MKKINSIADLSYDTKNINKGTAEGNNLLLKSLKEVGAGRSVLADKNGVLIAGNKTIEQSSEAGITKIKVVRTTGDEIVVVQRTDMDINSLEGVKMKILDNTVSKHNYLEDAKVSEAICEDMAIIPEDYGLGKKSEMVSFQRKVNESKGSFLKVECKNEKDVKTLFDELSDRGYQCEILS